MSISSAVGTLGTVIDAADVGIIVVGAAVVSVMALVSWTHRKAGDIIRTADAPTLTGVIILAGIVLIRTVLSFSLEVEITGRWPCQSGRDGSDAKPAPAHP